MELESIEVFKEFLIERKYKFDVFDESYSEIVKLCKILLQYEGRKLSWNEFKKHPLILKCIKKVEELEKKQENGEFIEFTLFKK